MIGRAFENFFHISILIDYTILIIFLIAIVGVFLILGRIQQNEDRADDLKRVGALLIVIAYALSQLVPSRFVAVSSGVEFAVSMLTVGLLIVGIALLFRS